MRILDWLRGRSAPQLEPPQARGESLDTTLASASLAAPRGWANPVSGLGTGAADAAVHSIYLGHPPITEREAGALWTGSWLAARAAELIPRDAAAPGWRIQAGDQGQEITAQVQQALALIPWSSQGEHGQGAMTALLRGEVLARVYGGALLVGVFDDLASASMSTPLSDGAALLGLRVYQRHEVTRTTCGLDPSTQEYGRPVLYSLAPRSTGQHQEAAYTVHASRCIRIDGEPTDALTTSANSGWGDSIYRRLREPLARFGAGRAGLSSLLDDAGTFALAMKNLSAARAMDVGGAINARLQLATLMKGRYRGIIYDSEKEDVTFKSPALAGVADLVDRQAHDVSGATGIPLVRLLGLSPGGLSTDDAAGTRNYHDRLSDYRNDRQGPALRRLATWGMWTAGLSTEQPWRVVQEPLGAPSTQEALEAETSRAQIVKILVDAGVPLEQASAALQGSTLLDHAALLRALASTMALETQ